MVILGLRALSLGSLLTLATTAPAQGALLTSLSISLARGELDRPRAIAALDDGHFLLLTEDRTGGRQLLFLQLRKEAGHGVDWLLDPCGALPEQVTGLFGGSGRRFYLLQENGDLSRCRLQMEASGPRVVVERRVVDSALRQAAELGTIQPHACAELPDSSLALAYGWALLHVTAPPATAAEGVAPEGGGPGSQPSWRWLVKRQPASTADPVIAEVPGLLVAVDSAGRVMTLDARERRLACRDLRTGQEQTLATAAVWPRMDLLPLELHGSGDILYVAARFLGEPPLRTLLVLEPSPAAGQDGAGSYRVGIPFIGMDPRSTFAASPGGHLVISEPWSGGLRWVPELDPPEGKGESNLGGAATPFTDRLAACILKGEAANRPGTAPHALQGAQPRPMPQAESLAAPAALQAKADQVYRELMAEERGQKAQEARVQAKRAKRAKRKAYQQRRREKEQRATAAMAVARPATAEANPIPGPRPANAEAKPLPGPRPANAEAKPLPVPPLAAGPPPSMPASAALAAPVGPRPQSAPPILEQAPSAPKGRCASHWVNQKRFFLSVDAVQRAADWMQKCSHLANPHREFHAWRLAGSVGDPRFSFGQYQRPYPDGRVLLQIRYLWAYARQIDGTAEGPLARELAASGGITGRKEWTDGTRRVTYGLEVIQDPDGTVLAIQPGGATRSGLPAGETGR